MPSGVYLRTEEHREITKRAMNRSDVIERISKTQKKVWARPGHKEMMGKKYSEGQIRRYQDPEERKKTGEALMREKNPRWKGGKRAYWRRLSRKAWEKHHGREIPKGMLIHHRDRDMTNIDPSNLQLRTYSGHMRWHIKISKLIDEIDRVIGQSI